MIVLFFNMKHMIKDKNGQLIIFRRFSNIWTNLDFIWISRLMGIFFVFFSECKSMGYGRQSVNISWPEHNFARVECSNGFSLVDNRYRPNYEIYRSSYFLLFCVEKEMCFWIEINKLEWIFKFYCLDSCIVDFGEKVTDIECDAPGNMGQFANGAGLRWFYEIKITLTDRKMIAGGRWVFLVNNMASKPYGWPWTSLIQLNGFKPPKTWDIWLWKRPI